MRYDQIGQIHDLHQQGQSVEQIAAAVGLEMGDVATVLASTTIEGSSLSVTPVEHVQLAFAHDTPGLTTGVLLCVPRAGDLIIDGWVEVDAAWDGTTPQADFGTFVGRASGMMADAGVGARDLTRVDADGAAAFGGGGVIADPIGGALSTSTSRFVPAKFTAANPVKLVVSQTGAQGGAAVGASQGTAIAHLFILR